jgi:hypothetical protein
VWGMGQLRRQQLVQVVEQPPWWNCISAELKATTDTSTLRLVV